MTWRKGDDVMITCEGKTVPGKVILVTKDGKVGAVEWDAYGTETMLAGHIGFLPLMFESDGKYRPAFGGWDCEVTLIPLVKLQ